MKQGEKLREPNKRKRRNSVNRKYMTDEPYLIKASKTDMPFKDKKEKQSLGSPKIYYCYQT